MFILGLTMSYIQE